VSNPELGITFTTGVLLVAALAGGLVARWLRLPRVTAYLLVGLLLGPQTLSVLPREHLEVLDPIGKLAMALVLFNIGCHFPLTHFRRIIGGVLRLSAGELALTFLAISLGLTLLGEDWEAAILLGALGLATAPATTVLVLKEANSEGPITERTIALVAINNLAAILAFEVLFLTLALTGGRLNAPLATEIWRLASGLLGSAALGVFSGLATSWGCGMSHRSRWFILLIGSATLVLGICQYFAFPYLLAFLAMGATVANSSDQTSAIEAELDRFAGLVCVVFFVIHGAEMDLRALVAAGSIGMGYIGLRSLGKYFGYYLAADAHRDGPQVKRWGGATLLSQAGAAIALSAIAAERNPTLGEHLQTIILGTVVFFEIVGPLFARQAVLRAGEVPLIEALHHTTTTAWEELQSLIRHVREAVGMQPFSPKIVDRLTIGQVMRSNIEGVSASATFSEVVHCIEHSHDNLFPVVGPQSELVGVIRYPHLRDALFDPDVGALVRAADLAEMPPTLLFPDDPLEKAWYQLRATQDDCEPVVSREAPHRLLGVVRRRDLFRMFAKQAAGDPNSNNAGH